MSGKPRSSRFDTVWTGRGHVPNAKLQPLAASAGPMYPAAANVNEARKGLRDKTFQALRVNRSSSAVIVSGENFRKISGYSSKADCFSFIYSSTSFNRDSTLFQSIGSKTHSAIVTMPITPVTTLRSLLSLYTKYSVIAIAIDKMIGIAISTTLKTTRSDSAFFRKERLSDAVSSKLDIRFSNLSSLDFIS